MKTYKTAQIAELIGVHPNTIRFYEKMKLLPEIPRTKSGYRIYSDQHLTQLKLLRTAFRTEIISDSLRQEVYEIVKIAASGDFEKAYQNTKKYLEHLQKEKNRAEEAINITLNILQNNAHESGAPVYSGRPEAAKALGVTTDVLRNWERNGLIQPPLDSNGYKKYSSTEMNRLKIIRTLRNAHYSMMAILRMLNHLDRGETNIRQTIDTPDETEDIISAADRYITALSQAEKDALTILQMLKLI